MSASVSPHGFETVRGRGYRPDDVDRRVEGLSIDRDSCWERAARLTVLANEMDAELTELRAYLAQLPPQTYESLGQQARLILTTAESEAARMRAEAEEAAEQARDEAAAYADQVRDAADKAAQQQRGAAAEYGRRTDDEARIEGAGQLAAAAEDAEEWRGAAAAAFQEMRRRTTQLVQEQEKQQAEEWDAAGRELAGQEAALEQRITELEAHSEAKLAERQRALAEAEEAARHRQEEAEDTGAEVLAQARVAAERIERATERVLREHDEERDELRAHMAYVRNTLAALTGKAPVVDEDGEKKPARKGDGRGSGTADGEASGGPDSAPDSAPVDGRAPVDPDKEETLETKLPRVQS
ncbi:coiled-coil domain-containing protein [Streptomyces celluloflavus]|uniref:cellulose-binding protein n=1 Tax=Streptomyces celluloflavus TaxID=58344 RepID=UPI0036ABB135